MRSGDPNRPELLTRSRDRTTPGEEGNSGFPVFHSRGLQINYSHDGNHFPEVRGSLLRASLAAAPHVAFLGLKLRRARLDLQLAFGDLAHHVVRHELANGNSCRRLKDDVTHLNVFVRT